jgi:hypothetical protein
MTNRNNQSDQNMVPGLSIVLDDLEQLRPMGGHPDQIERRNRIAGFNTKR